MNLPRFLARLRIVLPLAGLLCQTAGGAEIPSSKANRGAAAGIKCLEPNSDRGTSTAVIFDDLPLIHTTQLLPLNQRGDLVGEGDVTKQTEQVLANLAHVLASYSSLVN